MIILCYCNSCCSCSILVSPGHLPIIASLLAGQEMQRNILQGHSLCLSHTVCVCFFHRQSVSVTDRLCLSQSVCVCCRLSASVTGSVCLSHTVCVWHIHSSWSFLACFLLIYTWFSQRFVHETWICPALKHHLNQLCGPLLPTSNTVDLSPLKDTEHGGRVDTDPSHNISATLLTLRDL